MIVAWMFWWFAAVGLADEGDGYRIGPGDALHVAVYDEPSLTTNVVVSDGCTVTLALLGKVEVCGRTPAEVEADVTERYKGDFLVNPTVAIKVAEFHSQRVDLLGEVQKRGPIYLEGRTTLVEVISMAGGPTAENVVDVEVVSLDGTTARFDLNALNQTPEKVVVRPGDKVVLKPGKVVYMEGEVVRPGTVTLVDGLTVTQALALAGGAEEYGNLRRVLVRRADGEQVKVNVHRVHRGKDDDPVLKADDHVIVPKSAL